MTAFLLIRHAAHADLGERLSGRSAGGGLTDAGLDQAAVLAARMAYEPIGRIYSSPVLRARQTAAILAETIALPVVVDPAFDEIDYGRWTGARYAMLAGDPEWQDWNRHRAEARVPGGETMVEARDRALARLRSIARGKPTGAVAVVTHCDIIRAVLIKFLGRSLDEIHAIDVGPASVSRIELAGPAGRVIAIGEGDA